jgi:pSer/pThr/pTyr-binding forkhead associated (FHA) protein
VVIATGASIVLPAVHEAVVGRADAMSKFFPEVDLTPHGALDLGVGRRHARVFISNGQVMVEDLNSTNGTQLRGVKLAAKQPMVLAQGDEVVFGKLAMQILW